MVLFLQLSAMSLGIGRFDIGEMPISDDATHDQQAVDLTCSCPLVCMVGGLLNGARTSISTALSV